MTIGKPETTMSFPLLAFWSERNDAMAAWQQELLETCELGSRVWAARVRSEADLWSDLAIKFGDTRSAQEAVRAYQEYVARRMQIAADDTRELLGNSQKLLNAVARSFASSWPGGTRPD